MTDPLLTTPRLLLRPHRLADAAFMTRLNANPEVVRYTGDVAFNDPSEAVVVVRSLQAQFTSRRMGRLIAIERDTGEPVGWCGLRWHADEGAADLGYRFLQDRWGRGYATESSRACIGYGFEDLDLPMLFARAVPENIGSVRVLEKLGFVRIGSTDCHGMTADRYELYR
ncbi:MAG: ribosomal-protein-alanine N-acetyltransferase [Myxococcota bacterium]|jgi:ribosomal-protein-alanine N-acetyltransferase